MTSFFNPRDISRVHLNSSGSCDPSRGIARRRTTAVQLHKQHYFGSACDWPMSERSATYAVLFYFASSVPFCHCSTLPALLPEPMLTECKQTLLQLNPFIRDMHQGAIVFYYNRCLIHKQGTTYAQKILRLKSAHR